MKRPFKFRGEFDQDNQEWLYWSNKDGWGDFKSATTFKSINSFSFNVKPPIGTTALVFLNKGRKSKTFPWRLTS